MLQELGEMLWVERMLAFEVLPKLYRQARLQSLKRSIDAHLEQTKEHVTRVEQCFRLLDAEPSSLRSAPVAALASRHEELAANVVEERLADALHAASAAHTEHYEIAAYAALLDLLKAADGADAARLLEETKSEEEAALKEVEAIRRRLAEDLAG